MRTGFALRDAQPWPHLVDTVEIAETAGYEALFVPEVGGREAFSQLMGLAGVTTTLRLGTGVVPIDSRRLDVLAMGAATVHEASGGRMILGLGSGDIRTGALAQVEATVRSLRRAFAGDTIEVQGEPFALQLDPATAGPQLWIAALGPRMMKLAGREADGVLLNWCTPERVAEARLLVHAGAEEVGRDPAEISIGVYVRAVVGQEQSVADEALLGPARDYASLPAYAAQFSLMGLDPSDPASVAAEVCIGTPDAAAANARLAAYRDAGADLPIVYPVPILDPRSSIEGTLLALASQEAHGR